MKEYSPIVRIISCFVWPEIKQLSAVGTIVREAEKHKTATTVLSFRPPRLSLLKHELYVFVLFWMSDGVWTPLTVVFLFCFCFFVYLPQLF